MMKQKAIIVDLDGTLTDNTHRIHMFNQDVKDWTYINELSRYDLPHTWCQELVHLYKDAGYKIIFLTGRAANARPVTVEWLTRYISPHVDYELHMRAEHDHREDCLCKQEILVNSLLPRYDIVFAIDDRQQNVEMFRSLGIVCLHCKESDY